MINARAFQRQFLSDLKKARATLDLIRRLPAFLRERITLPEAHEHIQFAIATREKRFLDLMRTRVYGRSDNPYKELLTYAGCTYGDLEREVYRDGIERVLERLANEGVYLTASEFKGKKEVVRGQLRLNITPDDFLQPVLSPGFIVESTGSSNKPTRSFTSLEQLRQQTDVLALCFSAHGLFSCAHAVYDAILPGPSGINQLIYRAKLGIKTERWFARKIPANSRLEKCYFFLTTYLIVTTGKLFGPAFPRPEFLGTENVGKVVRWIDENRRKGRGCVIRTASSNAVRIAQAAWNMGISLEGSKCLVGGEPYTDAKANALQRAGLSGVPRYSFSGGNNIGNGCANPVHTDEVHLNSHLMAVICHPMSLNETAPDIHPLLFTALDSLADRLLLNVANGDYGTISSRDCGCGLQRAGLSTHLHRIRSYEKFTSEGMNYFFADLFEFIESSLPGEFGGGPGDYQVVEEEDDNAQTRLTLIVHPEIAGLDEAKILCRLKQKLAQGSRDHRFMAQLWQDAEAFRLRREIPYASPRGKILPLHIQRRGHSQ